MNDWLTHAYFARDTPDPVQPETDMGRAQCDRLVSSGLLRRVGRHMYRITPAGVDKHRGITT